MTKSTIASEALFRGLFRGKLHVFKEVTISLYCTNRTSLENLFYATRASIYILGEQKLPEGHRKQWKVMEGDGRS